MSHVIDWASNPLGIIDQLFGLYDLALEITTGFVFVTVGVISNFYSAQRVSSQVAGTQLIHGRSVKTKSMGV